MFLFTHHDNDNFYLSDPDVVLMMEFQKGNNSSFESLMHKYYARILNFIHRFVNNRQIAEDLTQDVFMKVYKSGPAYRAKSKFQTWIFTIAKNTSLNELRKLKRPIVSMDESFEDDEGGTLHRQIEDEKIIPADQKLMNVEEAAQIKAAINSLPENQKMAVLLRRYENFSYEEIAETLGVSVEAVKSLLSRAKESLKNKLKHLIK